MTRRYRVTIAITLTGHSVGYHDLTVTATDADEAARAALMTLGADYDERHRLECTRVRLAPVEVES